MQVGDVHDIHVYPGPASPPAEDNRAAVLGEFGGLGLPLVGHTWQNEKNWGYRNLSSKEELNEGYLKLLEGSARSWPIPASMPPCTPKPRTSKSRSTA